MIEFLDSFFGDNPIKEFPCANLTRAEWLAARSSLVGFGGSEAGTLLGLDSYKDPVRLFYEKCDPYGQFVFKNNKDNIFAFMGRQLEDKVAELWEHFEEVGTQQDNDEQLMLNVEKGYKLKECRDRSSIIMNEEYPFLFANIDKEITKHPYYRSPGILEIKTISGYVYDKWTTGLPPKYVAQPQLYMLVTGADYAEIVMLKDGRHLELFEFESNPEFQEILIRVCYDFYLKIKEGRERAKNCKTKEGFFKALQELEPDPVGADYTQFVKDQENYRGATEVYDADESMIEMINLYQILTASIKKNRAERDKVEVNIRKEMTHLSAKRINYPGGHVAWNKKFLVK